MKGEIGKYHFLFFYLVFLFFIMYFSAQAGGQLIKNAPPPPTINIPVYPPFEDATTLNNRTGTNCYFTVKLSDGSSITYKWCTQECLRVSPDCASPNLCTGALSCIVTTDRKPNYFFIYTSFIIDSITYFFRLMGLSTDFFIFGLLLITPFIIVLVWIIAELIAEIIPG